MMMSDSLPPDATLTEVLSARALRAQPSRLWLDVIGGAAIIAVALWARPTGWVAITSAATCVLAYGVWAWCERRLRALAWPFPQAIERRWRAVQLIAGVTGLAAFALFLLAFVGLALGPIVS
jgi:hypothetical protein